MATLTEIYPKYSAPAEGGTGDKGTAHSYINHLYTPLFERLKDDQIKLLEIGVGAGHSIKMWHEYFKNGNITGIDIDLSQVKVEEYTGIRLFEGNATSESFCSSINFALGPYDKFDIIIDDGSHSPEDQKKTFDIFYPQLNQNGIYVIEDVLDSRNISEFFKNKHLPYFFYDGRSFKNRHDDCAFILFK